MCTSTYSPFLFDGVIFRKASSGQFPTSERRSEFKSIRESTYVATKRGNSYQLWVQLLGLRQRDLKVNLNNNLLKITGSRSYVSSDGSRRKRYKFQQTFYVDDTVDKDKLTADLKDEVLILSVPFIADQNKTTLGDSDKEANQVTDESEIENTYSIDSFESLLSTSQSSGCGSASRV
mmetsp:Transcript_9907/g.15228  ORF Transcript_9907/g.15228 Transcript_9907/m.15228 type:complete len:177 (-) Transcript_9907:108-638(-)|eukprot:CAMPEP_0194254848 /NCGR_PEP_ID=MMETSP0158-20130606/33032_1 /TAXON_ID=33649 /ORGANISM="Thalassionema nitzschioides, Strain L26-B" /LENGTH=176 /DNA_ID=CAMNT_0038993033 /DNA_START=179 /DNA_END=709 /DNA_ORIENTATION=-